MAVTTVSLESKKDDSYPKIQVNIEAVGDQYKLKIVTKFSVLQREEVQEKTFSVKDGKFTQNSKDHIEIELGTEKIKSEKLGPKKSDFSLTLNSKGHLICNLGDAKGSISIKAPQDLIIMSPITASTLSLNAKQIVALQPVKADDISVTTNVLCNYSKIVANTIEGYLGPESEKNLKRVLHNAGLIQAEKKLSLKN